MFAKIDPVEEIVHIVRFVAGIDNGHPCNVCAEFSVALRNSAMLSAALLFVGATATPLLSGLVA